MRARYLIAAALILSCAGLHAAELYKWTDENGVTHYTDKPPAGKEVETRGVNAVDDSAPLEIPPKIDEVRCGQLRDAKRVLETFEKVEGDTDGDGVKEMLNEAQKKAELNRVNNMIERLCKNAPPAPVKTVVAEEKAEETSNDQIADDRDYFAEDDKD